jgi:V-type H+-transporting ATPase subunit a
MGFMATFCGSIYNEFFALGLNMWGSCFSMNKLTETGTKGSYSYTREDPKCTYPWGMDPGWTIADGNELLFVNSVKMKMAVIFGVLHMSFGVCHKGANALYRKDFLTFFTEVIPGICILWCLFGWMDMLILVKFFKTFDIDSPGGETLN